MCIKSMVFGKNFCMALLQNDKVYCKIKVWTLKLEFKFLCYLSNFSVGSLMLDS